jgi:hypothetical protein
VCVEMGLLALKSRDVRLGCRKSDVDQLVCAHSSLAIAAGIGQWSRVKRFFRDPIDAFEETARFKVAPAGAGADWPISAREKVFGHS